MKDHHIQCTAIARSTGGRCKRPAVGGKTLCGTHGGRQLQLSGGAFAQLYYDLLTDDEKIVYGQANTDPVLVMEHSLKLLQVKQYQIQKKLVMLKASGAKITSTWNFDYLAMGRVEGRKASIAELTAIADMNERKELSVIPDDKARLIQSYEKGYLAVMDQIRRMAAKLHQMKNPVQSQINVVGQVLCNDSKGAVDGNITSQTALPDSTAPLTIDMGHVNKPVAIPVGANK